MDRPSRSAGTYRIRISGQVLVEAALEAAGFSRAEVGEADADVDLVWTINEPNNEEWAFRSSGQWINHVPGISVVVRKDGLWRTVAAARRRWSGDGPCPVRAPETFLMPDQAGELRHAAARHPTWRWIEKPKAAARGEGIRLVDDVLAAETGPNWLVQRYIDRPHLIDGYKYTLRRYVLISSTEPFTAWLFDDGFTKFTSRPFSLDGGGALDRFAHLTNPDVQAQDPTATTSSRNLVRADYRRRLALDGHDPDAVDATIERAVAALIEAAAPELIAAARRSPAPAGTCFELLGVDVCLDEELRPWLLECNLSPSVSVEADTTTTASTDEHSLKVRLLADLLEIVVSGDPGTPSVGGFGRLPIAPMAGPWAVAAPVETWELDGALVLFDRASGSVHLAEGTAAYVWAALTDGLSEADIAEELRAELPEAGGRVDADIEAAISTWAARGLLRAASPDAPGDPATGAAGNLDSGPASDHVASDLDHLSAVGDMVALVRLPDAEAAAWTRAVLGALEVAVAERVHLVVDVTPGEGGWLLDAPGERFLARSPRHLGLAIRDLVIAHLGRAASVHSGSLLEVNDRSVLVLGPAGRRARLLREWAATVGTVLGDDLVHIGPDGSLTGHLAGVAEPIGTMWEGPLPGLDADPLLVSTDGLFVRMLRPGARGATVPVVRASAIVRLVRSPSDTPSVVTSVSTGDVLRTMFPGTVRAAVRPTAAGVAAAVALLARTPCFDLSVGNDEADAAGILAAIDRAAGRGG